MKRRRWSSCAGCRLGSLGGTIPRYVPASSMSLVGTGQVTPGSAPEMLVATQLRGRPMSRAYHQWRHTSDGHGSMPTSTARSAGSNRCGTATATPPEPLTWAGEVAERSCPAVGRQRPARPRTGSSACRRRRDGGPAQSSRHGARRLLVRQRARGRGLGEWGRRLGVRATSEVGPCGTSPGSCSATASTSTGTRDRVGRCRDIPGCVGEATETHWRTAFWDAAGTRTWCAARLARSLRQLDLPTHLWYDVALTGIGEIAATANQEAFGHDHLRVLATLPIHPSRPRRRAR